VNDDGGSPSTGHLFSQMPQPVHFSSLMIVVLVVPDDGLIGTLFIADEADLSVSQRCSVSCQYEQHPAELTVFR